MARPFGRGGTAANLTVSNGPPWRSSSRVAGRLLVRNPGSFARHRPRIPNGRTKARLFTLSTIVRI